MILYRCNQCASTYTEDEIKPLGFEALQAIREGEILPPGQCETCGIPVVKMWLPDKEWMDTVRGRQANIINELDMLERLLQQAGAPSFTMAFLWVLNEVLNKLFTTMEEDLGLITKPLEEPNEPEMIGFGDIYELEDLLTPDKGEEDEDA